MKTNNKLRDALKKILNLTNSLDDNCAVDPVEIRDIARDALKERPKNCEVGTVEEQAQRFNDYCHKQGNSCCVGRSKGDCPMFRGYKVDCAIVWAQMPYEEGGAK